MNYIAGNTLIPLTTEDIVKEHNELTDNEILYRLILDDKWIIVNSSNYILNAIKLIFKYYYKNGEEELELKDTDPCVIYDAKKMVKGILKKRGEI
jgi:hypothetical protein